MNLFIGIIRYLLLAPLHWLLTILSYVIVPFLVLFQKDAWLPKWCWWFQTWDNSLDGDSGWLLEHRPWLSTPYYELSSFKLYISRVLWLYRNPVYGFERVLLSAGVPNEIKKYGEYTNNDGNVLYVSDNGYFFWNDDKKITSTKN